MSDTSQAPETPAEKTQRRTGKCGAVACVSCEAFAYDGLMDGFRICTCGHTQNSHTLEKVHHGN